MTKCKFVGTTRCKNFPTADSQYCRAHKFLQQHEPEHTDRKKYKQTDNNWYKSEKPKRKKRKVVKLDDLLASLKITNRSSFRTWALKNHPDKGGNEELFKKVSDLYDKKIYENQN